MNSTPALLALLFAGCTTPSVDLDPSLSSARTITFGGVWPIAEGRDPLGVYPSRERIRHTEDDLPTQTILEAQLSYTYADFEERLGGGDSLTLDDTTFSGPTVLDGDVQLAQAWLAVGKNVPLSEVFRARGVVGLSFAHMDLRLRDGSGDDKLQTNSLGPMVGAQLGIQPHELFELSIQGTASLAYAEDANVEITEWRAVASFHLGSTTTIFGGWRGVRYTEQRSDASSDVFLDLNGPVFGISSGF